MNAPISRSVDLVVGPFEATIGGPFRTVAGYARLLISAGIPVRLWGMNLGIGEGDRALFRDVDVRDLGHQWRELVGNLVLGAGRPKSRIVFGVWHRAFAVVALQRLLLGRRRCGALFLVPTQSLSPWDWRKHKTLKLFLRPLLYLLIRSLDGVIFATEGEAEVSRPRVRSDRRWVLYHPLRQLSLPKIGNSSHKHRVGFLGRINVQKDLELFIEVVSSLGSEWEGVVIGGGEQDYIDRLAGMAAHLECSDRIVWLGWREGDEALEELSRCRYLLVTSHAENYCHAAVEAMAIGVPVVIVNRVAAARDMALLGTAAVVSANPYDIAEKIHVLEGEPASREGIVKAGLDFARARQDGSDGIRLRRIVWEERR